MPCSSLPHVAVVVLAYNNFADTSECLESVSRLDYANRSVVVVDNGSTDRTAEQVGEHFPDVAVLRTPVNRGVPSGYNLGIRYALSNGAEFVFLLNNDTSVSPNLLSELMRVAASAPYLGILMPKVVYYDEPELVWSAGARYRRFPPAIVFVGRGEDARRRDVARDLEYAPSCGLLVSRATFERIGLFDEGYLFYYDDWDFCDRTRAANLGIRYVPTAMLRHKVSRTIRARKQAFWHTWGASCARYYRRHGQPLALDLLLHMGYILLRELTQGHAGELQYFLRGAWAGLRQPLGPYPTLNSGAAVRDI